MSPKAEEVEDCNIGTDKEPKYIKIEKVLPEDQKKRYVELFKEYIDVFAWTYEDLKTYDTDIIQHKIPLKKETKPFRQKLRQVNPILLPIIEKEIQKLLNAKIIISLRYSEWVVFVHEEKISLVISILWVFLGLDPIGLPWYIGVSEPTRQPSSLAPYLNLMNEGAGNRPVT